MNSPAQSSLIDRLHLRLVVFILAMTAIIAIPAYLFIANSEAEIQELGDYKQVSLKAMSDFPFDQSGGTLEDVPARWRALDGERILVTGEIYAPFSTESQINSFELVYSISQCCLAGPPQIQHFVAATVAEGTVPRYRGLVRVFGTLHVDVEKDPQGNVARVFRMDVERVEPV